MKKFLRGFLVVTIVGMPWTAQAVNWKLVSQAEDADHYIDLDSVKNHPISPNIKRFWVLINFASKQSRTGNVKAYRSGKVRYEVDCNDDSTRGLAGVAYSEFDGRGESIFSWNEPTEGWKSVIPGSIGGAYQAFVCQGIARDGLVPIVGQGIELPKPQVKVSPEFTRAYNKALIAMGDKASTLKADQQQWWKKREETCIAIPSYLYDACMQKEEKDRIIFLNEMEKAFSGTKSTVSTTPSASSFTKSAHSVCSAAETELFMCTTVNAKIISICSTPSTVTYRFGPPSKLQMTLTRNRDQVTYIPWDASGRAITSSISVPNSNTSYQVYYEQDRNDTYREGGVRVIQNRKVLTTVQCAPETISNFYENTKTY